MKQDLPRWPRIAVAAAAVVGLGVGVAGTAVVVGSTDGDGAGVDGGAISLVAYDSCASALRELQSAALPHVGAYGMAGDLQVYRGGGGDVAVAQAVPGAAREAAPEAADSVRPDAAPEHSGTNNYESDVDEPDIVKTDGRRVVSIVDGRLRVVDVATRKHTADITLPNGGYATQLLVSGDRALVLTGSGGVALPRPGGVTGSPGEPVPDTPPDAPPDASPPVDPTFATQLVLADLTGAGKVLGTLGIEGGYLDARQVGSVARVVVRSFPRLKFAYPDGRITPSEATDRNRAAVTSSSISDWLPRYQLSSNGHRSTGELVDCTAVSHPRAYTGASMLTVLTVDLTRELGTGDPISIAADGNTVYGSGPNLYVADDHVVRAAPGSAPVDGAPTPAGQRTEIYQFDVSGKGRPVHVASGRVDGSLLSQYSLSEHDGNLRVATTIGSGDGSHSGISVLTRRGARLTQVGRVDGLGKGERIFAVRFLGDTAYVVTFRQTDPLYTVDLSDPAKPRVTGELAIPGYSAYLHPLGDGRLLGVGEQVLDGMTSGTQVSLFDVSGARDARRVGLLQYQGQHSEVEGDPHAFLYWPAKNLVVLPMSGGPSMPEEPGASGAVVLRVSGNTMTEVGTVRHQSGTDYGPPRRALVIGGELWTVSAAGILVSNLDSLAEVAWLPFG